MALLVVFALLAGAGTAISPACCRSCPRCCPPARPAGGGGRSASSLGWRSPSRSRSSGWRRVIDGVGLADDAVRTLARSSCWSASAWSCAVPRARPTASRRRSRAWRASGPRARGDGFWSGLGRRRRARLRLRALRRADPGRGDRGQRDQRRVAGTIAGRDRLRARLGGSCCWLCAFGGARARASASARAGRGPGAAARARRRDDRSPRVAMATEARRALPDGARQPPARRARQPDAAGSSARTRSRTASTTCAAQSRFAVAAPRPSDAARQAVSLPVLGDAPDFTGNQRWFNTPGGKPLTLAGPARPGRARRLLDLHLHQLPPHAALPERLGRALPRRRADDRRRAHARVLLRAATPATCADAIGANGIRYPVAQDNDYATWDACGNQYWPAKYLIDARGRVRYTHFGEGDYDADRGGDPLAAAEAGAAQSPGGTRRAQGAVHPSRDRRRPRPTSARARRALRARRPTAGHARPTPAAGRARRPATSRSRAPGTTSGESATGRAGRRDAARRSSAQDASSSCWARRGGGAGTVAVLLDGKPIGARRGRRATSTAAACASIASACTAWSRCRASSTASWTLRFAPGVAGYAFTFG